MYTYFQWLSITFKWRKPSKWSSKYSSVIKSECMVFKEMSVSILINWFQSLDDPNVSQEYVGTVSKKSKQLFETKPIWWLIHLIHILALIQLLLLKPCRITSRFLIQHLNLISFRERTKAVYRAFGRGTVQELYRSLVDLKVSYLVIQEMWCFGQPK